MVDFVARNRHQHRRPTFYELTRTRDNQISIKEHINSKLTLPVVVEAMKKIGDRITALENKRNAPRQAPPQQPAPQAPTKDTKMQRNPALAPRANLTFNHGKMTRDQQPDRNPLNIGGSVPFGSFTTADSINAENAAFWKHNGAVGQGDTPQGTNQRGNMVEALSNDPAQGFASELNAIPTGSPQEALNAYHRAWHGAKTPGARDAIEKIWRDSQRSYNARGGV